MKSFLTILFLGFTCPVIVLSYTEVINNVINSVNTGGNNAGSGQVVGGEAQTEVQVYTEINGKVVEDINQSFTSETGHLEVKVESENRVNIEGQTETKTQIEVNKEILDQEEIEESVTIIIPHLKTPRVPLDTSSFWIRVSQILKNVFSIFKFK